MRRMLASLLIAGAVVFASPGWALNVNTADAKTLAKELDGVGDKLAAAMIKEREKAPFTSLDDIDKRVKGWGKKTSEKNKAKISFADK